MEVSTDALQYLFYDFRTEFNDWFLAAVNNNDYTRLCTVLPSKTKVESLNWISTPPQMSEWLDARKFQSIGPGFSYNLANRHFEVTVELDRDDLEDDTYNLFRPKIAMLGQEAGRYPNVLATTTLQNGVSAVVGGQSNLCYDGQTFFATTHAEGVSGTQSNLQTGTGNSVAQIRTDFTNARAAMRRMKDTQGRPMGIGKRGGLVVYTPPEMEDQFDQLANNDFIVTSVGTGIFGQQNNSLKGAFDVVVEELLTDTNDWYLFDTNLPIKPLIYLDRKAPEFTPQDDPRADPVFTYRKFRYGVDFRAATGYGWWQLAQKISNT